MATPFLTIRTLTGLSVEPEPPDAIGRAPHSRCGIPATSDLPEPVGKTGHV